MLPLLIGIAQAGCPKAETTTDPFTKETVTTWQLRGVPGATGPDAKWANWTVTKAATTTVTWELVDTAGLIEVNVPAGEVLVAFEEGETLALTSAEAAPTAEGKGGGAVWTTWMVTAEVTPEQLAALGASPVTALQFTVGNSTTHVLLEGRVRKKVGEGLACAAE